MTTQTEIHVGAQGRFTITKVPLALWLIACVLLMQLLAYLLGLQHLLPNDIADQVDLAFRALDAIVGVVGVEWMRRKIADEKVDHDGGTAAVDLLRAARNTGLAIPRRD